MRKRGEQKGYPCGERLQFAVRVEPEVYEALKLASLHLDISVSEAARRVLANWRTAKKDALEAIRSKEP